jgi:hypothetical protein
MPIAYGQTIAGTLGPNEQDVYTFTAPADGEVLIRVQSVSGAPGTSATLVRVGSGNEAHGGGDGLSTTLEQPRVFAGNDYQILVPALPTGAAYPGQSYRVLLQNVVDPVGALAVPIGGGGAGSIDEPGEMDFFTVAAHAGDELAITATRASGTVDPSAVVYIPSFGTCTPDYGALDDANNPTVVNQCSDYDVAGAYVFAIEDVDDAGTDLIDSIETGGYAFTIACVAGPCLLETTTTTTTTTLEPVTTTTAGATTTTTLALTVDRLVFGKTALLRDRPGKPQKRKLSVVSKDASITLGGGNGSGDDPRTAGATLRVRSTAAGFDATYALPAARWKRIGKEGRGKGYRYADAHRASGPVTSVVLKPGSLEAKGRGAQLAQSLATDPTPVDVAFLVGTLRYCARFGGDVTYVAGRKFQGRAAPASAVCP